jgi:hypothetical protein
LIKALLTAATVALTATASFASDLTILNSGSKTGGFSMQSTAYSQDLAGAYNVTLVNPGDRCVALGSLLPNISGPILMPWASDYEAVGRDGGCVTFDVTSAQVLRYDSAPLYVCTRGGSIKADSGRVGHTVPVDGPLATLIREFNTEFGTDHTPVVYDGSGDARLALINGEVDYALLSKKHVLVVTEADSAITCDTSLASAGPNSLPAETGNQALAFGWDMPWLALNMSEAEANELQRNMMMSHLNCSTAIGTWTKCNSVYTTRWDLSVDEVVQRWEPMVKSQQQ